MRNVMGAIYKKEDISFFGQLERRIFVMNSREIDSLSEEETKKIKIDIKEHNSRGSNRVDKKIKGVRQNFSKAAVSCTRSANGKIVLHTLVY